MPCYEIREVSIRLDIADREVLLTGLRAAGAGIQQAGGNRYQIAAPGVGYFTIDLATREIVADERVTERAANWTKRAYSTEVVKRTAKRFGYQLQETDTHYVARRRF